MNEEVEDGIATNEDSMIGAEVPDHSTAVEQESIGSRY